MLIMPDENELETQMNSDVFITYRELLPRNPINGRFIENNDPFQIAQFTNTN